MSTNSCCCSGVRRIFVQLSSSRARRDANSGHGEDLQDAPARAFWRRQGWEQGLTIFSIYADLPGDPELQAVWERYTPEE